MLTRHEEATNKTEQDTVICKTKQGNENVPYKPYDNDIKLE